MPRSMLFSRKRQNNAPDEEQTMQPMNEQASEAPTPSHEHEQDDNPNFSEEEDDDDNDEEEERPVGGMDFEQPLQGSHHVQVPDSSASMVAGQELNKAIWCFMSIFNQQRQQLLQLDQQRNLTATEINEVNPLNVAPHQLEAPLQNDTKQAVALPQSSKRNQQKTASQSRHHKQKQQVVEQQQQQQQLTPEPDYQLYDSSSRQHLLQLDLNDAEEDSNSPNYSSPSSSSNASAQKDHGYLASGSSSRGDDNHHCQDCGKGYSTSSNLARHRQTHRAVTDKKAKKCPDCNKVYVSMPAFSMHIRTHDRHCICSYCGKSFSRPWLLQGHIRTHTGEKPFSCKICDKAFADKSNLRAHIQTHSTTKPFVCDRCNKAFALKSYLCKHVDSTCMRATSSQKEPLNLKILNYSKRAKSGIR